jgi:hypothetical protein
LYFCMLIKQRHYKNTKEFHGKREKRTPKQKSKKISHY